MAEIAVRWWMPVNCMSCSSRAAKPAHDVGEAAAIASYRAVANSSRLARQRRRDRRRQLRPRNSRVSALYRRGLYIGGRGLVRRLSPDRLSTGDLFSGPLSRRLAAGMALAIKAQIAGGHRIVGLKLRAAARAHAVLMRPARDLLDALRRLDGLGIGRLHQQLGISSLGIGRLGISRLGISRLGIGRLGIDRLGVGGLLSALFEIGRVRRLNCGPGGM